MQFASFPNMIWTCTLPLNPLDLFFQHPPSYPGPSVLFPNGQSFEPAAHDVRNARFDSLNISLNPSCVKTFATPADKKLAEDQKRVFNEWSEANRPKAEKGIRERKIAWEGQLDARLRLKGYWDYCFLRDEYMIQEWQRVQENTRQWEWDVRRDARRELEGHFVGNCVRAEPRWEGLYIQNQALSSLHDKSPTALGSTSQEAFRLFVYGYEGLHSVNLNQVQDSVPPKDHPEMMFAVLPKYILTCMLPVHPFWQLQQYEYTICLANTEAVGGLTITPTFRAVREEIDSQKVCLASHCYSTFASQADRELYELQTKIYLAVQGSKDGAGRRSEVKES
ncbi:hypothetical protein QBC44DRAFT_311203 [Cladorrhinum sp. PSN332]|nr:hypothetical protein QBC44DRAFT_311203 [Cladorrhinum sp. PSN332]